MQVKTIFFETVLVINNEPPLKKRKVTHDYIMLFLKLLQEYIWANGGVHLDHILPNRCLLSSFLQASLNKVIFPVTVVTSLHYIQHAFSFKIKPVGTMTNKTK